MRVGFHQRHLPDIYETQTSAIRIPLTIACTVLDKRQVLVLEWIDQGEPTTRFWPMFGEQLAAPATLFIQDPPALIDPAVYYGLRSVDLAMTTLIHLNSLGSGYLTNILHTIQGF